MKSLILTIAAVCAFSTYSFSQFQFDLSAGLAHVPTQLSLTQNGYFVSANPSFNLKHKFRLRTGLQYRRLVLENFEDKGNLDLSTELEYRFFKFISASSGFFYSHNFNEAADVEEFGATGSLKFNLKDVFFIFRLSKDLNEQVQDILDGNNASFFETSRRRELIQVGLGYTFGKK